MPDSGAQSQPFPLSTQDADREGTQGHSDHKPEQTQAHVRVDKADSGSRWQASQGGDVKHSGDCCVSSLRANYIVRTTFLSESIVVLQGTAGTDSLAQHATINSSV